MKIGHCCFETGSKEEGEIEGTRLNSFVQIFLFLSQDYGRLLGITDACLFLYRESVKKVFTESFCKGVGGEVVVVVMMYPPLRKLKFNFRLFGD